MTKPTGYRQMPSLAPSESPTGDMTAEKLNLKAFLLEGAFLAASQGRVADGVSQCVTN